MEWVEELAKTEGFEWDDGNTAKSHHKHQVSCQEAEEVFFNHPLLVIDDPVHSHTEPRAKVFGVNNEGRRLTVSFTIRQRLIRIISARPMNRKEKKLYEKQD